MEVRDGCMVSVWSGEEFQGVEFSLTNSRDLRTEGSPGYNHMCVHVRYYMWLPPTSTSVTTI